MEIFKPKRKKLELNCVFELDSAYNNTILIYGNTYENDKIPFTGRLKITSNDNIIIKNIKMKLLGKYKIFFLQQQLQKKLTSYIHDEWDIVECNWDNLLVDKEGKMQGIRWIPQADVSSSGSSSSINTMGNVGGGEDDKYLLQSGSIGEFEFSVNLPNDIPETVEGLGSGSILYTMRIDIKYQRSSEHIQSNFEYIRIIRTFRDDNMNIGDPVILENNVRGQLQYNISIESRGVNLNDKIIPIRLMMIPYKKGFNIQRINCKMIQLFMIKDRNGVEYFDESIIQRQKLNKLNINQWNGIRDDIMIDKVDVQVGLKLPQDLKSITPYIEIGKNDNLIMEVRHVIELIIIIRKPEIEQGEFQIKVRLPILIYLSAMTRYNDNIVEESKIEARRVIIDNKSGMIHFRPKEKELLFRRRDGNEIGRIVNHNTHPLARIGTRSSVPPRYEEHRQDILINNNNTHSNNTHSLQRHYDFESQSILTLPSYRTEISMARHVESGSSMLEVAPHSSYAGSPDPGTPQS